jgi:N-acetylmuramate 1-kinase
MLVMQSAPPLADLPALTSVQWAEASALIFEFYAPVGAQATLAENACVDLLSDLLEREMGAGLVMILRDFHAENLIWLADRKGPARAGLLDFQLAQLGHPVYDLVSLLQDARRDVHPDTVQAMKRRFCDAKGMAMQDYDRAAAVWGAQRALRILGVFARLALQSGKTGYLSLVPRVWGHLQECLGHPALAELCDTCVTLLPAPTPAFLAVLRAKAGG